MKIYAINKDGEEISKEADKGYYGEDVYNDRVWSTQKPPKQAGKIAVLEDKAWRLKDDVRGTYYRKEDGQPVEVRALTAEKAKAEQGIDITELVKDKPAESLKHPYYDKGWKEDTKRIEDEAKTEAKATRDSMIFEEMRKTAEAKLIAEGKIQPEEGKE